MHFQGGGDKPCEGPQSGEEHDGPPARTVPFAPSGRAVLSVDAQVFEIVVCDGRWQVVVEPSVDECDIDGMVSPALRRVLAEDRLGLPDEFKPLPALGHGFQPAEEPVEFRVLVVGVVEAPSTGFHASVFAGEEEKEVLGIGVVRHPSALEEELPVSLVDAFAATVEVAGAFFQRDPEECEAPCEPLESVLEIRQSSGRVVQMDDQRRSG